MRDSLKTFVPARRGPDFQRWRPFGNFTPTGVPAPSRPTIVVVETYDEFAMLADNASEVGLAFQGPPAVRRTSVAIEGGQRVSSLVWGTGEPELVFIHGGAQNSHTWDTVALALDRPLVCIDMPGHGHSDWREDGEYWPERNADALSAVIEQLAPKAAAVIGMSLGGLTTIVLGSRYPALVRKAVLVDVTPGVNQKKASAIAAFIRGPESFAGFDEILARTMEHNSTRTESSLRRGVLHNARAFPDGTWKWRYDRIGRSDSGEIDFSSLWDDISAIRVPILLARGMAAGTVVDDEDEAELLRRQPTARVERFEKAGHSLQGDTPVEFARLIDDFVFGAKDRIVTR